MRQIFWLSGVAVFVIGLGFTGPAYAQSSPAGDMKAPNVQPQGPAQENLPPALPGAGAEPALSTAPAVHKVESGDPTAQLFAAINSGDYNSAQDAVSRGADLNAQDSLGETPLDLSVGLNQNSITFMLLAARNEAGDDGAGGPVQMSATPAISHSQSSVRTHAVAAKLVAPLHTLQPVPGNNPGTPNPSAGFLGFNH
jgi:hypothetical protein